MHRLKRKIIEGCQLHISERSKVDKKSEKADLPAASFLNAFVTEVF